MAKIIHRLADFGPACGEPNVWDDLSITWSNVTCPACRVFNPDATGLDRAFPTGPADGFSRDYSDPSLT